MSLRVAACAFPLRAYADQGEWVEQFRAQARFAADSGAKLVVFPEYVTAPLIVFNPDWSSWTALWTETAASIAKQHDLVVLAGSHLVEENGQRRNRSLLMTPSGTSLVQDKLHPTPWEKRWKVQPTNSVAVIDVLGCRLAILICYDVEFPEAVRCAAQAGAEVLLVPSWTDDAHGFHRVRHTAHARAIENGVYVVHAPLVGSLTVPDFEQACGSAGVLSPCDIGFATAGLVAGGAWNLPDVVVADLDLDRLRSWREKGTVTPLKDARPMSTYAVHCANLAQ